MRYMGGKSRIAPHLAKVILESTSDRGIYLEPFVGGGAMFARMAPHFDLPIGGDAHEDCALMWQAVAEGWAPPSEVSEAEYAALKHAEPSALRGFVGFGCSFGGKWFGGYASTPDDPIRRARSAPDGFAGAARKAIMRDAPPFTDCAILHGDYARMDRAALPGAVIYCDPPYAGTTTYRGVDQFDPGPFWATMREWSGRGAHVFVSEHAAPADWRVAFEIEHRVTLKRNLDGQRPTVERLFTHD